MTPVWYGAWMGFNDRVSLTIFDPIVSEMSAILGEQAGLSADTIVRDEVVTDATIAFSGGATAIGQLASPMHDISYQDIVRRYAALEADGALPVDGDDFILIIHPHSYASLMLDPTWVNLFEREAPNTALRNGYVGRLLRMKVFVSSNVRRWIDAGAGGTTDVYAAVFLAKESYGILGVTGAPEAANVDNQGADGQPLTGQKIKPIEIILKQLGSAGASDPLNQRGTLAWKAVLTPEVLNPFWVHVLRHTNAFSNS